MNKKKTIINIETSGKSHKKAKNKIKKYMIFLFPPKTQLNENISRNMRE